MRQGFLHPCRLIIVLFIRHCFYDNLHTELEGIFEDGCFISGELFWLSLMGNFRKALLATVAQKSKSKNGRERLALPAVAVF